MGKQKPVPHRLRVSASGYAGITTTVQLLAQTTVRCAVTITVQTADDVTSGQLRHLPLKLDDGSAVSASGAWIQDELAIGFFLDPEPTLEAYQLAAAANFT